MECIFCKIANKEIESRVLYEDEVVIVIMDLGPVSNGHSLVIPKKHFTDINEVDTDTLMHMFLIAKKIGSKIMKKLDSKSLTYLINYGDDQQVKHLHLHIIPDYTKNLHNPNLANIDDIYKLLK